VRLLDDVQAAITASTVTPEIQQSITGSASNAGITSSGGGGGRPINWPGAVASLLNGCNKLSRSELSDVQALKDLRQDMSLQHTTLQQGLVAQLENWIFAGTMAKAFNNHHHHLSSMAAGHLLDTDASVTVYVECLAQLGSVQVAQQDLLERLPSRLEEAVLQAMQSLPLDQRASSVVPTTTRSTNVNINGGRMVPVDVSIAAANVVHAAVTTCEAVLKNTIKVLRLLCSVKSPSPSAGLVDLLFKKQQANTPEGAAIVIPQGGTLGEEVAKRHSLLAWAIVQLQVQAVVSDILDKPPTQLHHHHHHLYHLQALGSPPGTTLYNTINNSKGEAGQPLSPSTGSGKSPFLPKWLRDAAAAAGGGASKTDFQPSIVTFSLDHEDSPEQGFGSGTNIAASRNDDRYISSGAGTRRREEVHTVLGGSHKAAGPALLPSIYHEVVTFIERAEQLVTSGTGGGGGSTAVATQGGVQQQQQTNKLGLPLLFIKNKTSSSSSAAAAAADETSLTETELSSLAVDVSYHHLLRDYLDNLVRLEFLPFVAVEVRARCVSVFSSSEAFQPQRNSSSFAARAALLDASSRNNNTAAANIGGGGNEVAEVAALNLASTNPLDSTSTSQMPAIVMIEALVEELMGWAEELPEFGAHLSGVIENALGRFAEGLTSALETAGRGHGSGGGGGGDNSLAGRLASAAPIARLMAQESAAALLGSSSAFSVSSFKQQQQQQQQQGSGGGVNVHVVGGTHYGAHHNQHQLHQNVSDMQILKVLLEEERPIHKNELLAGGSSTSTTSNSIGYLEESCRQLVAIAALGEAAERIADVTVQCMAVMTPNARTPYSNNNMQNDASSPSLATTTAEQQSPSSKWQTQLGLTRMMKLGGSYLPTSLGYGSSRPPANTNADQELSPTSGGGMSEGLYHLEAQYRALAGLAARILRLEMLALVIFHLSQLTYLDWCGGGEGGGGGGGEGPVEADDRISAFTRKMTMIHTNLAPYLPKRKQQYIFGCVGPAVPRVMIQLLPEFDMINHAGAARACRMLNALQAAFGTTAASDADSIIAKAEGMWWWSVNDSVSREYDLARLYYTLATHSPEGIIATAKDKPHRFSKKEWMALLRARVMERQVKPQHKVDLEKVMEEAEKRDGSRRASQASTFQSAMQSLVKKALK